MKQRMPLWKEKLKTFTPNEYVVLLFVFSLFVSVFFEAALMLLLPAYILLSKQFKLCLPRRVWDYFLLLFSLLALLSTYFYSKNGIVSDFEIKKEYLLLLGIGIVILCFDIFFFVNIMTKKAFLAGIKLSVFLSLTSFLISVFQLIFKIYPDPIERPGRVASVYMNENYYGTVLEFICLFALYLICKSKNVKQKILYSAFLILNLISLWFCQTRMAFIVVAVSFFIFLFFYKRKISYCILGFIGICALALIFYPQLLPRFDSIASYFDFRLGIWECALRSFRDSPLLGRGYFSYSFIWRDYFVTEYFPALHAHNLYIELLINFGLLGSIPLALFCISKCISCIKNCIKSNSRLNLSFVIAAICAVCIHGLADTTILWPQTGFFAVFVLSAPKVFEKEKED